MHYQLDLEPAHSVIRLTILEEMVSLQCAETAYRHLRQVTSVGGPYAGIYDLTRVKGTSIPTEIIRALARRPPPVPTGRPHILVGKAPVIFGLARLFQMTREHVGELFDVVRTLEEAYAMVEVRPEDFTEHIFTTELVA